MISSSRRQRYIAARAAGGDDDDVPSTSYQNSLEITIKRKSKQVEAALQELGMEGLEERLSSATQNPASPAYRLSRLVAETTQMQGRAVIVVEVTRPTPATTPQQLANIAKTAIQCGADALCVRLDTEDTPQASNGAQYQQIIMYQLCYSGMSSLRLPGRISKQRQDQQSVLLLGQAADGASCLFCALRG
jgi:hypothetical protein